MTEKRKIRIGIIIPRMVNLGPILVMQNLVNTLVESEALSIRVFYMDNKVDANVRMLVPAERLKPRKFRFTDFDIIHTNGIRPDLFAFWNRRKIKYHISTIHNFVFEDLAFTYNRFISLLFGSLCLALWKRADKMVCLSDAMKQYYAKWFSSAKMEVIYNGISETYGSYLPDNDIIQSIDKFHYRGFKVVGCAGILTARKGFDQILHLLAADNDLAAVILGDGKELAKLKRLAEKLHISNRCEFAGFKSNAVAYFSHFDFFIMPSRSEGFGLALIEAVQQKVPVICSDIDVFKELLSDEEAVFFKMDDIASLVDAMKTAKEGGHKKTDHAYKRYHNNYTAGLMAKCYAASYQSVFM